MNVKSIVSYNLNGIRAAMKKDLIGWVKTSGHDVYCFQETKAHPDQVDAALFEEIGYKGYWVSAEKKGYSGVAIFSKIEPDQVIYESGIELCDHEGRIIRADFGDTTLLNCYFPSGTTGEERQTIKYKFLDDMYDWVQELKKTRPKLIIVGDYNIAHTEKDIHNPKSKNSGFLPDERAWLTKWFESGFVDSFRFLNPEQIQYSWWTYRFGARKNNKGWRIDYQSVTENMKGDLKACQQLNDVHHSDHCPVLVEFK